MVGRRISPACSTCRKRRVKCGLEHPACLPCVQAGWICPGYTNRFISYHDRSSGAVSFINERGYENFHALLPSNFQFTPLSTAEKLRTEFVQAMEGNVLAAKLTMMPKMHILIHIPDRIGQSEALDDAVRCLTHGHRPRITVRQRQNYIMALQSLTKALRAPKTRCSAETIAAASLLQMYEIHTDFSGRNWVQHARGTVKVLQLCGSAVAHSRLERAILAAEAAELFLTSLTARQYHFLQLSGWKQHSPCPAKATAERSLDKFIRVIFDGHRFDDAGKFCSYFASRCEFSKASSSRLHGELAVANISDLLRLRRQLLGLLNSISTTHLVAENDDAADYVASMVIECFLLIVLSYILWSREQSAELHSLGFQNLPDGLTEAALERERSNLFRSLTARSNILASMDSDLRMNAIAALQVILGSLQTTTAPGLTDVGESTTLIKMLDAGLQGAGWA